MVPMLDVNQFALRGLKKSRYNSLLFVLLHTPPCKLDDGWPESAEEHVTLVFLLRECVEYIKSYVVS